MAQQHSQRTGDTLPQSVLVQEVDPSYGTNKQCSPGMTLADVAACLNNVKYKLKQSQEQLVWTYRNR